MVEAPFTIRNYSTIKPESLFQGINNYKFIDLCAGNVIVMRRRDIMFISLLFMVIVMTLCWRYYIIMLISLLSCSPPQAKIFKKYSLLNVFPLQN